MMTEHVHSCILVRTREFDRIIRNKHESRDTHGF